MFMHSATNKMLVLLTFSLTASAQWQNTNAVRHPAGVVYSAAGASAVGTPMDTDGWHSDGPHSVFDRLEQRIALTTALPENDEVYTSPGIVSVSELRHRLSRKGASLIREAQRYSSPGKHAKAIEVLTRALQEESATGYARSILGSEYLKIGDIPAAIANLKEAVALLPLLAPNHSNLGYALCRIGETQSGEREIREAIKVDRNSPKTHYLLGLILLNRATPEARGQLSLAQYEVTGARLALAVYHTRRGEASAAGQQLQAFLQMSHSADSKQAEQWFARTAALDQPAAAFGFPATPVRTEDR